MIDILCLRQAYERRLITEIVWIDGTTNPADAMTKSKPCQGLKDLIDTNKINIKLTSWVERGNNEEKGVPHQGLKNKESPVCVQLYNNLYPFSPILSCAAIPNRPGNRPLSEHQESGQSDRSAPKCTHQSNPGLLGRARVPVRLNQNRNDRTTWAGAGCTELTSQSEAACTTRLFATEQSGINGTRLYSEAVQGIGGIPEEYRDTYRNRGTVRGCISRRDSLVTGQEGLVVYILYCSC